MNQSPQMNDATATQMLLFQLYSKVAMALAENTDVIVADPTLWRQDVHPAHILFWMTSTLTPEQLQTLAIDDIQLANVLAVALSTSTSVA